MTNEGLFLRYTLIASHPAIRHTMFIPFCLRLYLALRVVTRILGHYSLGMLGLFCITLFMLTPLICYLISLRIKYTYRV